jgi:hypothetical protein
LVFRILGTDYVNSIIIPAARLGVGEATAQFKSEDAYATKRAELQVQLQSSFAKALSQMLSGYKELTGTPFTVQLLLRNIESPKRFKEAIEMKLQAQQEAQKMQFILDREMVRFILYDAYNRMTGGNYNDTKNHSRLWDRPCGVRHHEALVRPAVPSFWSFDFR